MSALKPKDLWLRTLCYFTVKNIKFGDHCVWRRLILQGWLWYRNRTILAFSYHSEGSFFILIDLIIKTTSQMIIRIWKCTILSIFSDNYQIINNNTSNF